MTSQAPQPAGSSSFPIVAIGASAGGLEACRKLLGALQTPCGKALILVQHLDPTHESMMVDLLASHTRLTVLQAADGMRVEREHLYVIPPGAYLAISDGALHLSQPEARHGARMPLDFLLSSLAAECGTRAICVILSGTGSDGSRGLKAVAAAGGLVLAQDPADAGYDGMPRSAIETGLVAQVLPASEIPAALALHDGGNAVPTGLDAPAEADPAQLAAVVALLRTSTAHDFSQYKPGTLQRRVERRIGLAGLPPGAMDRYLVMLKDDPAERESLACDVLINVTQFFRDPGVFATLAADIVPGLVEAATAERAVRIWVPGCSTGEETYSLAMLFREHIDAMKPDARLQIFASDADPAAIAQAREGVYPFSIEADVSPARLKRFFTREDHGYRVTPELRAAVVYTVQDVLSDPPFSRLDMVSCRNLLIYFGTQAQARVIALFHFALRPGGILLLGSAETPGSIEGRFQTVSKAARLYRQIGRSRPGASGLLQPTGGAAGPVARPAAAQATPGRTSLADLNARLVLEHFAPASVLINARLECLHLLGPTDRYLRVSPGALTHDLLAMARDGYRGKLRSAIQQASQNRAPVVLSGCRCRYDDKPIHFRLDVRPVVDAGEDLILVCFVADPPPASAPGRAASAAELPRVAELEQELEVTRMELQGAIRSLEISGEEQKAINEEALSVNEEYQSTNEELLTSKEELQSLNEELTALNTQLQETLEQQRTTANDLQNVLYSTDVATLFLDVDLKIRFFTPATRLVFNVIATDVGRPLADLASLAVDAALAADSRSVLETRAPIEREIQGQNGAWFTRRVLPYRTHGDGVEGVVITFIDITERKHNAEALDAARHVAELANVAKSRFLASASHDLRQPLQTLTLLQGLLAKTVQGEPARRLVARLDPTLGAMSGMLNALLDINQIEAGTIQPALADFPVNDLLDRMRDEFTYHAQARGLRLIVMPCRRVIRSDPRLLEQMVRNLLSNAFKYTKRGKILLGCRTRGYDVSIGIWDTGIGIPEDELEAIFQEYHQIDNPARERSRGMGLGLAIVQQLGVLLGHAVTVRSRHGKGSVFAIDVPLAATAPPADVGGGGDAPRPPAATRTGAVLIVEDDPEIRALLGVSLQQYGHRVWLAVDGPAALRLVRAGDARPDMILADYNLPGGMTGLQAAAALRDALHAPDLPVIVLTGDISTATLRHVASDRCVQLNKPVNLRMLTALIQTLLPPAPALQAAVGTSARLPTVFVVDDDSAVRQTIRLVLEDAGAMVEDYASCEAFLDAYKPGGEACLLIDAYLPGMDGFGLLKRLDEDGRTLPSIMMTGRSDVPMAVRAMKAGTSDFIEKPINVAGLLASVRRALDLSRDTSKLSAWQNEAAQHVASLTPRQRQVMDMVLAGTPSKNIAADLGINQRTVENHRASIMRKTGSASLPALARMAVAAAAAHRLEEAAA